MTTVYSPSSASNSFPSSWSVGRGSAQFQTQSPTQKHTIVSQHLGPLRRLPHPRKVRQFHLLNLRDLALLRTRRRHRLHQRLGRHLPDNLGDAETTTRGLGRNRATEVWQAAAGAVADVGGMDVWLGDEDVALGGTVGEQFRRGLYDLAAGLELGIIGGGGKSAPAMLASRARGTPATRHGGDGLGGGKEDKWRGIGKGLHSRCASQQGGGQGELHGCLMLGSLVDAAARC